MIVFATLFILAITLPWVVGADATLTWDMPTEYTDDTPCTNLAGAIALRGTTSGVYTETNDVGLATETDFLGLAHGVHYFAVAAYTTEGAHSEYSEELRWDARKPKPPTGLRAFFKRVIAKAWKWFRGGFNLRVVEHA